MYGKPEVVREEDEETFAGAFRQFVKGYFIFLFRLWHEIPARTRKLLTIIAAFDLITSTVLAVAVTALVVTSDVMPTSFLELVEVSILSVILASIVWLWTFVSIGVVTLTPIIANWLARILVEAWSEKNEVKR